MFNSVSRASTPWRGRRRTSVRSRPLLAAMAVAMAFRAAAALAAEGPDATIFRVVLTNGTAVVSYGEYARVGDRVIFSMPIGKLSPQPRLHLVSLPMSAVDWPTTERYAESARYSRYAATRGESDFALLSGEVAQVLNTIALTTDPVRRLEIAEGARRILAEWPKTHFGYRAGDVAQILALLDEAISEFRAAVGATQFDLNFVATVAAPQLAPLLPDPSPAASLEQALSVARASDVPAERLSLLSSIAAELDAARDALPASWVTRTRALVRDEMALEFHVEAAYANLSREMMKSASAYAARADVRGIETVLVKIRDRDRQLGRKRQEQINGLLRAVAARLDAARRLRLARDQWTLRSSIYRGYRGSVNDIIKRLGRAQSRLQDIRTLAGPSAPALAKLSDAIMKVGRELAVVAPPEECKAVHALLTNAVQLAETAVRVRREAVASGSLRTAWDASAAAAGSMMLFSRARTDMEALVQAPQLR